MQTAQDKVYSIGEASKLLGVSIETLRRWEKIGKITIGRTPGGTRVFTDTDIEEIRISLKPHRQIPSVAPKSITPTRVLSLSSLLIALLILGNVFLFSQTPIPQVLSAKTQTITSDISHKVGEFIVSFLPERFRSLLVDDSVSFVSLPGGITVNGDNVYIGSSKGTTTVNNNLQVLGSSTLSDLSVLGFLDVAGPATVSTLKVTGQTVLGSTLLVLGPASFSSTINGNTLTDNKLAFSEASPSIYPSPANSSISIDT